MVFVSPVCVTSHISDFSLSLFLSVPFAWEKKRRKQILRLRTLGILYGWAVTEANVILLNTPLAAAAMSCHAMSGG